jgi:hypothetical protein
MKINWGTKIAVLYCSFVALIIVLVFLSMNQKIELESKDYYAKELAFQSRIDATNNANNSKASIQFEFKENFIQLNIHPQLLTPDFKGEVFFYRPSNSKLDVKLPLQFNAAGLQTIPISTFKKGIYDMELTWSSSSENYFKKIKIHIP